MCMLCGLCLFAAATGTSMQLIHHGALFYRHYERGETVHWRCARSNHPERRCRARLTSVARTGSVSEINAHNHAVL